MINRNAFSLIGLATVLFLFTPVASHEGKVFFSKEVGKCVLIVETADDSRTFRLRVHSEGNDCHIDKETMSSALKAAFSKPEAPKLEGIYLSLSIGRLIDYPWLSQYLAATAYKDPAWDRQRGKPVSQNLNKYVSNILSGREVTAEIEKAFSASGYRVISAVVEKVCVGRFRNVPMYQGKMSPGRVPIRNIFHLLINKNGRTLTLDVVKI